MLADFHYAKGNRQEALVQYIHYKTLGGDKQRAVLRIQELAREAAPSNAGESGAAPESASSPP
jgi:hypothetical protein